MCAYLYRLTVTYYGDVEVIGQGHWTLNTSALFDGLVGALVQVRDLLSSNRSLLKRATELLRA